MSYQPHRRSPVGLRAAALGLALLLLAAACARAQAPQAKHVDNPAKLVTSVEGITEYRLDNGLRVLLFPDESRPKVTVNLTVFVGSRHEGYGETGMAHLLEHMVFKGTADHPDIPGAMKERGAQFNGTTSYDRTNYFETLTATDENLEFALKLEADRMVNSPIKGEDLSTEFSVVRNEFEMGENSPDNVLSRARRGSPRIPGHSDPGQHPGFRALRPPLQGSGRDEEGLERRGPPLGAA
jgi:zinc protease